MGGKAVKGISKIPKDNKSEVYDEIYNVFGQFDWQIIGSFNSEKTSNDVDLIVKSNLTEMKEFLDNVGVAYVITTGFNQISVKFPIGDYFIQLDLILVENMDWAKWIFHVPKNSLFSGRERNQLLMATIVSRSTRKIDETKHSQLSVILHSGVYLTVKENKKVISREFLTDDPKTICQLVCLDFNRTNSYEEILGQVKNDINVINKYNEYARKNN
jgi:hypothetical protein